MASSFKSIMSKDIGVTPISLVTVPAATEVVIINTVITNTTVVNIAVDLYVTRSAVNYYLLRIVIPPNAGFETTKTVLQENDILKIVSDTAASCDIVCSYLEKS